MGSWITNPETGMGKNPDPGTGKEKTPDLGTGKEKNPNTGTGKKKFGSERKKITDTQCQKHHHGTVPHNDTTTGALDKKKQC